MAKKKRKKKKARSIEFLTALLHCKGGAFRDERTKRTHHIDHVTESKESTDD